MNPKILPPALIENKIFLIRGEKVLLDAELASLYGVTTSNLNKAVKRNIERFPADFMFKLSKDEYKSLRFQFGILKKGQHSKYLPFAFTEQGVAMLSSVLKSKRAVQVNIQIMRTFVKLREMISSHKELEKRLAALEKKFESHDKSIVTIFEAIRELMLPPKKETRKIGFEIK